MRRDRRHFSTFSLTLSSRRRRRIEGCAVLRDGASRRGSPNRSSAPPQDEAEKHVGPNSQLHPEEAIEEARSAVAKWPSRRTVDGSTTGAVHAMFSVPPESGGSLLGKRRRIHGQRTLGAMTAAPDLTVYVDVKSPYAYLAVEPTRTLAAGVRHRPGLEALHAGNPDFLGAVAPATTISGAGSATATWTPGGSPTPGG